MALTVSHKPEQLFLNIGKHIVDDVERRDELFKEKIREVLQKADQRIKELNTKVLRMTDDFEEERQLWRQRETKLLQRIAELEELVPRFHAENSAIVRLS